MVKAALWLQGLHQLLERQVLMGLSLDHTLFDLAQKSVKVICTSNSARSI